MIAPTGTPPSPDLDKSRLDLIRIASPKTWWRIYPARQPNPLGWGPGLSRFGAVDGRAFSVVYLGSTFRVVFIETLVRDRGDGRTGPLLIAYSELAALNVATIETIDTLALVDLCGSGGLKMGVPSDVARASDQRLARQWSEAFHRRKGTDGVHYPSRLIGEINIAVYDRARGKLAAAEVGPLTNRHELLGAVLEELSIEVI